MTITFSALLTEMAGLPGGAGAAEMKAVNTLSVRIEQIHVRIQVSPAMVERWFLTRAMAIVSQTGMPALAFETLSSDHAEEPSGRPATRSATSTKKSARIREPSAYWVRLEDVRNGDTEQQ